jgi:hypothetical protein
MVAISQGWQASHLISHLQEELKLPNFSRRDCLNSLANTLGDRFYLSGDFRHSEEASQMRKDIADHDDHQLWPFLAMQRLDFTVIRWEQDCYFCYANEGVKDTDTTTSHLNVCNTARSRLGYKNKRMECFIFRYAYVLKQTHRGSKYG